MCTRVFNNRNGEFLTTARNMDWKTQLPTSFYSFQAGLVRSAMTDELAETYENWEWTSKFASIVTMVGTEEEGMGTSDGINSSGLVVNVLYAKETDYTITAGENHKYLSVLRWAQYVLDNFDSVDAVDATFAENAIEIIGGMVPGSTSPAAFHLSVSDASGGSLIIEVYGGRYHIHNSSKYTIMTNEPSFDVQLKLNDYWLWQWSDNNAFPSHTIPGGPFPSDRFERAAYYYNSIGSPKSMQESLAQSKSIAMNACVPIGMKGIEGHPNISPTIWTTLSDQTNLIYYFSNARTPNVIWFNLKEYLAKLTEGKAQQVAKLNLVEIDLVHTNDPALGEFQSLMIKNHMYNGCVNDEMTLAIDPFCVTLQQV